MEENEQKSSEQCWKELLDIINRQMEINTQLKSFIEAMIGTSTEGMGVTVNEEKVEELQNLFIELESLQAQERALYHSLFGDEE